MNPHGYGFLPFTGGWWLSLAIACAITFVATFAIGTWKGWLREQRRQRSLTAEDRPVSQKPPRITWKP